MRSARTSRRMGLAASTGNGKTKTRKARNRDVEFRVESKYGMRYVELVHKSSGMTLTKPPHALSVSSASEWICLMDAALARVDLTNLEVSNLSRDNSLRAIRSAEDCFTRQPSCYDGLTRRQLCFEIR